MEEKKEKRARKKEERSKRKEEEKREREVGLTCHTNRLHRCFHRLTMCTHLHDIIPCSERSSSVVSGKNSEPRRNRKRKEGLSASISPW